MTLEKEIIFALITDYISEPSSNPQIKAGLRKQFMSVQMFVFSISE